MTFVYVKLPLSQLKPNTVVGQLGVIVQPLVEEEREPEQENVSLVQILQVLVQVMALKVKLAILMHVLLSQPHLLQQLLNGMSGHHGQVVQ